MVTVVVIFYSNRDTTLSKGLEGQIHYPKEVGLPVITRIHASCQIIRNKFTNIISHLIEFAVHYTCCKGHRLTINGQWPIVGPFS